MTFKALVKRLLESGLEISAALKESAGLIEVYIDEDGEFKEAVMVKNDETLVPVAPESMWQQFSSDSPVTFTAENPSGDKIFIRSIPCSSAKGPAARLIVQMKSAPSPAVEELISITAVSLSLLLEVSSSAKHDALEGERHRKHINSLRSAQASLFPTFNDIEGFDIASAYLPAAVSGGSFIDAYYPAKNRYQIVICDIIGSEGSSALIGSAIRTLTRSESAGFMTPSTLTAQILTRLKQIIPVIDSIISVTICHITVTTGQITISSNGTPRAFFFKKARKNAIHLKDTPIGQLQTRARTSRDIVIQMHPGDILLIYSSSITRTVSEDGKRHYPESSILQPIISESDSTATDITHSVIESLYDFTNFGEIPEDILLLTVKK